MKFTKMPTETFKQLTVNAGVILKTFDPADPKLTDSNILGATSGGVNVSITRTFEDYGSDIDNCPADTKELKKCTAVAVKASGSFVTMSPALAAMLAAAADIDSTNNAKVTLRRDLLDSDFSDLWIVGDYSDKNGEKNGGYIAIKLIAALSTGGFVVQTKAKQHIHLNSRRTRASPTRTPSLSTFTSRAGQLRPRATRGTEHEAF